jgi:phage FluMu protein Com
MEKENSCFCLLCTGLARREEFPYITYYCPHCHALNRPKQSEEERVSGSSTPNLGRVSGSSTPYLGNTPNLGSLRTDNASGTVSDSGLTTNSPVRAGLEEIEEVTEKATSEDVASSKADLSGTICN